MPSPTLPDDKGDKGLAPPFGTALSPSGSSRKGVSPASPLQSTGAWTPGPWVLEIEDGWQMVRSTVKSDILGCAESCASGHGDRWDHVNRKITAARAIIAKAQGK